MSDTSTMKTKPAKEPRRSRAPWFVAAAAAVVAVLAVGAIAINGSGGDETPMASEPLELTAGPSDALASCIMPSPEIVADVEVAFKGTVTGIDGEVVTLEVTDWYQGGDAPTVIVTAPAGFEALIGSVPFAVGEHFLVTATNGTVNYCGLSGPATPELQALFDAAFPG
ncbi:MAG: hypothetical protein KDB69_03385 [Acidimicrobiia bacterium]|nr:hypothetical protein [Acidimicrobiia bacterium]